MEQQYPEDYIHAGLIEVLYAWRNVSYAQRQVDNRRDQIQIAAKILGIATELDGIYTVAWSHNGVNDPFMITLANGTQLLILDAFDVENVRMYLVEPTPRYCLQSGLPIYNLRPFDRGLDMYVVLLCSEN
jgi:hypothetical protein